MKPTLIPIVINKLGTMPNIFINDSKTWNQREVETIQTSALLRSARIRRRVLKLEETSCHSNFIKNPTASAINVC